MKPPTQLFREPWLQFVVLGAILLASWQSLAPTGVQTIRVEAAAIRAREAYEEDLLGRPLTDEERANLAAGQVDDEVLLHEALRRGMPLSDGRTRRRLIQIMRSALVEEVPPPSVAQLQAFFRENIEDYTSPESATVDQVPFPWGEEFEEAAVVEALEQLRSGADPEGLGGSLLVVGRRLRRATRADFVGSLGADVADQVEALPVGEWHGPFQSPYGRHLIRVVERHPPQVATFEQVEPYLTEHWIFTKTRERQQELVDEIRAGYRIELTGESAP